MVFELTKEQSLFYDKVIGQYFGDPRMAANSGARSIVLFEYEVEREMITNEKLSEKDNRQFIQQRNLYDFMRRLLVKRFRKALRLFRAEYKPAATGTNVSFSALSVVASFNTRKKDDRCAHNRVIFIGNSGTLLTDGSSWQIRVRRHAHIFAGMSMFIFKKHSQRYS